MIELNKKHIEMRMVFDKRYFNDGYDNMASYLDKGELLPMNAVKFEWQAENVDYYVVHIADNSSFEGEEKYTCSVNTLELNNLIPGREYYWKVKTVYKSGEKNFSQAYRFKTEGHVRALDMEGVSNVRDVGGFPTKNGKKIRYGLLFRSGKGEDITDKGKNLVKKLGIKTDMDLRGEKEAPDESPFGKDLNLLVFNGAYYTSDKTGPGINGAEEYRNAFRDEIKACADPANYPMIIHCSLGRDRTGTLAFVILSLCGVDPETLITDHMLSFLSVDGQLGGYANTIAIQGKIKTLYNEIYMRDGETFTECVENVVKDLGVTDAEIASIRNILTE